MVSTNFTQPFKEPISYGRYIASLANILGNGVIVQRLGDLQKGRRSTKERLQKGLIQPSFNGATPGDLSFVLPYRYLCNIVEMLNALEKMAPGTASRHGAGVSRGLIQASVSGVIAADSIINKN